MGGWGGGGCYRHGRARGKLGDTAESSGLERIAAYLLYLAEHFLCAAAALRLQEDLKQYPPERCGCEHATPRGPRDEVSAGLMP